MAWMILRRMLSAVGVLLLASIVIFVVIAVSGDPLADLRDRQPPVPPSVIQAEEQRLGLDLPLHERYLNWVGGLFQGDLGPSTIATRDIGAELTDRIGVTLRLVVVAVVIALILALIAGTVSGLRQRRFPDLVLTPMTFVMLALPSFWMAVLFKQWGIYFNEQVGASVFATVGANSVPPPQGFVPFLLDSAAHLVLPTLVLILVHFAAWSRYQRTAIAESLAGDHVRFAVLKGLSRGRVVRSYVVRPALVPIITVVALDLPVLLSGAVITETVFQWRGMGGFLLESINLRDGNAVLAWLLIAAFAVVVFNLIADLLYAIVDPRVRYGN
ncbi:peptide/nickel transport system permease protein [Stackebrandtia albiflava]|uniref:Peptide/nickel transport system permease protein n=1 Tax=Stackebrandtia albiflava TaxID=406432 RepID=A0A562UQ54_9ACTN|nr:ABC transporter permease [Stackebrandtia albiflava]TWJ07752.1 peptide/nickel transport system permease protein [Stackebrandtia albiflava]